MRHQHTTSRGRVAMGGGVRAMPVAAALIAGALGLGGLTGDSPAVAVATGAATFQRPEPINDAASPVGTRHAALDLDAVGNAVAVWESGGTIYGSRKPVGGSWSAPAALRPTPFGGPDVVALAEDGSAYFDYGIETPDGEAIARWASDGSVDTTGVGGQYAEGRDLADSDGDVIAYVETANGATTYYFAVGGTNPVDDGWTSATTLQSFGNSRVTFGAGHTYLVAYPPDASGPNRRFRVTRVDGSTGDSSLVIRRRLCGQSSRLSGYDLAAGRHGAAVLAWRCMSSAVDSVNVQRIATAGVRPAVEIAHSRETHVVDPLSGPETAYGPGGPTIVFSRATTSLRRTVIAVSHSSAGHWRHNTIARGVRSHSAAALALRLDWSVSGAELLTYRRGGFHGSIWAVRHLPGAPFDQPTRVFPSARVTTASVADDGLAAVARVAADGRFIARFASPPG